MLLAGMLLFSVAILSFACEYKLYLLLITATAIDKNDQLNVIHKHLTVIYKSVLNNQKSLDSGCGPVGRVVAFNSRGPQFESSLQQNFIMNLFTVNC